MKKLFLLFISSLSLFTVKAQFTAGNIAVLRVGDSVSTLANTGNNIAIDQFTLTGTYVNTNLLPRTGSNAVCLSGTATSEGMMTLAGNKSALVLFAYKTAAPYASSISATTSATVNRAVVSVNASGVASIPTLTATSLSGNNPRHVFSNGTNYWGGGGNTGIIFGNASSNIDTIVTTSSTNTRFISNAGTQLYYSTAVSGAIGIWKLGNGAPTNSGNIATPYITLVGGTGNCSPYGFSMKYDSSICYVADDRSIANGGGIQKWTRSGSTWTLAYTLGTGTGSTVGARGLAVDWTTTPPTIIATTAETTLNRVIRINDTNSTVTAVTLATATTNTIFRGIAFTPGTTTLPVKLTSFSASTTSNNVVLNWSTTTEVNNYGFELERSTDNNAFEKIGFVKGNGTSNSLNNYQFIDNILITGTTYYRLKQIDFDGQFTYADIVKVSNNNQLDVIIGPNPFNNEIKVTSNQNIYAVEVIDMTGKVCFSSNPNSFNYSFKLDNMNNGIYFIRVNNGEQTISRRIIKN